MNSMYFFLKPKAWALIFLIIGFSSVTFANEFNENLARTIETRSELYNLQVRLIRRAQNIRIAHYNFSNDNYGMAYIDELIRASLRGANVYLIIDSLGVILNGLDSSLRKTLKKAGVKVKVYRSLNFSEPDNMNYNRKRLHEKVFIADDYLITGSSNIGKWYFKEDFFVIDLNLLIQGPATQLAKKKYDELFNGPFSKNKPQSLDRSHDFLVKNQNNPTLISRTDDFTEEDFKNLVNLNEYHSSPLKYVSDTPSKETGTLGGEILNMIRSAKVSIKMISPYPFFPDRFKALLKEKQKQGVKIELLTSEPEHMRKEKEGIYGAFLDQQEYYKRSKISMYAAPGLLHAKILIVDTENIYIGGHNFDILSFDFNLENGVFLNSLSPVARKILAFYSRQKVSARPIIMEGVPIYDEGDLKPCTTPPINYFPNKDQEEPVNNHHRCKPYWPYYPNLSR